MARSDNMRHVELNKRATVQGTKSIILRTQDTIITKPLSKTQIKKHLKNGRLSVNVTVSLCDMIDNDLEAFNDWVESITIKEGILSDINYSVVGSVPATETSSGLVIINVDAEIE